VLPLVGYTMYAGKSAFVDMNPAWAAGLLVWAAAATLLAWWLVGGGPGAVRALDGLDRHAARLALGMIVAVVAVLVAVNVLQVREFALGVHAEDSAYYNQLLWNTLHGDFLSANVQQARLFDPPVSNELALHVSPVLLVALLPVYALLPGFLTLLVVRDVALAAAAWPLFLLARDRLGGVGGLSAATLYLANPAILAQGFQSFSLVLLAPLPFFLAFRAFLDGRFARWVLWTAVAMAVREDVAIAMAGFGVWALLRRRPLRWWVAGLGVPAAWWGFTTLVIQPAFGRLGNNVFEIASAGGREGPLGIYHTILQQPAWLLEGLSDGGLYYLYRLLRSVGFLAVLGWEGLLAGPVTLATLVLGRVFYSGIDPISRFAVLPSCALVAAAIAIVGRVPRGGHRDARALVLIVLVLLPSVSLVDGAKDAVLEGLIGASAWNDGAALREAVEHVPEDASLAAPTYALPAVSKRATLYTVQYLHMYPAPDPEYFLLDRNLERISGSPDLRRRYVTVLDDVSRSSRYERVWQRGEYVVYRRVGGAS
jgi:hypothetical protein